MTLLDQNENGKELTNDSIFEPTCAHCTVGSYASLSVRMSLDQNSDLIIIHILKSIASRVLTFGRSMDVNDPKHDLDGQGGRSKVKVTGVVYRWGLYPPLEIHGNMVTN